jgi:hypothetical protein
MRKLTIKRKKSFVASLAKLKVYIEDPAGELDITGIKCRLLGTLANGEEKSFYIEENAAKVFVIADKMSRDYCYDCRNLPEGNENIYLTGKNAFNPATGNAFRFEGGTDEEIAKRHKESKKGGLIVLITAIVIGLTAGWIIGSGVIYSKKKATPKDFSYEEMTITLTALFKEEEVEGRTVFTSNDVAVFVLRENFVAGDIDLSGYTVRGYAELARENNPVMADATYEETDGVPNMVYTYAGDDGKTYVYFTTFYKSSNAFWIVQYFVNESGYESRKPKFIEWAKTVHFAD